VEVDLDNAPFCSERSDHIIAQIPRRIAQSAATGMRGENRSLTLREYIAEHFVGDMRYVHDHSKAVHFPDYLLAKSSQAIVDASIRCRIGPFDVHVVGQSHIFDAERSEGAQCLEAAVNHLPAFDRQKDCNSSIQTGLPNLVQGLNEYDILTMKGHFATDGIDLTQRAFDGLRTGYCARLPNRKENRSDSAAAHSRNIDAAVPVAHRQIKMVENDALSGVYMCIDNDGPEMKIARFPGALRHLIFARQAVGTSGAGQGLLALTKNDGQCSVASPKSG